MLTMSVGRRLQDVLQAQPRHYWAVLFLVATGCGMRTSLKPPANGGGDLPTGGAAGQGAGGNAGGTEGTGRTGGAGGGAPVTSGLPGSGGSGGGGGIVGTGGTVGRGGTLGSGGTLAAGGSLIGSGGAMHTGGVKGLGGVAGNGGLVPTGGTPASGGAGGTAGTTASVPAFGMVCTTNDDCPSGSTCCNGSSESCDGTRLPTGDGTDRGEFVVSADGLTVTDTITGLVWQLDGSGTRAGCTTDTTHLTCTWAEAKAYCASLTLAGVSGWRLPALMELETIVDPAMAGPAIDATAFPNTTENFYWTSSSIGLTSELEDTVVAVDFSAGEALWTTVESVTVRGTVKALERVRCVAGSRCYPTSRFVASSSGLITDTLTNLVWQQQASTTDMTWDDAKTYCAATGSGFRLPTLKELESLVDLTVTLEPTINQTSFPNTPGEAFWTSSPYAPPLAPNTNPEAWIVFFSSGVPQRYDETYNYVMARCVR